MQYHCPTCSKVLPAMNVLTSGALAPRKCTECGSRYYAGGMEVAMAAIAIPTIMKAMGFRPVSADVDVAIVAAQVVATALAFALSPPRPAKDRTKTLTISISILLSALAALIVSIVQSR